jgi:hypothetical protein
MSRDQFDPSDPFQQTIESLRVDLVGIFSTWVDRASKRNELNEEQFLQALVIGWSVAMVGCINSFVMDDQREAMADVIADYLPTAIEISEEIRSSGKQKRGSVQ